MPKNDNNDDKIIEFSLDDKPKKKEPTQAKKQSSGKRSSSHDEGVEERVNRLLNKGAGNSGGFFNFSRYPVLDKIARYLGLGLGANLGLHPVAFVIGFIIVAYLLGILLSPIEGFLIIQLLGATGFVATILGFVWSLGVIFPLASRAFYYGVRLLQKFMR